MTGVLKFPPRLFRHCFGSFLTGKTACSGRPFKCDLSPADEWDISWDSWLLRPVPNGVGVWKIACLSKRRVVPEEGIEPTLS